MFATLFLGAVLAVFMTVGVVRGDAETGLLQPLVVRPLGRGTMLVARWAGAAVAAAAYVVIVYAACLALTAAFGDWSPDHVILPGATLAGAVVIIAALSTLASVVPRFQPRRGSRCSWSSAPGSSPGFSGRSATRSAPRLCSTSPT